MTFSFRNLLRTKFTIVWQHLIFSRKNLCKEIYFSVGAIDKSPTVCPLFYNDSKYETKKERISHENATVFGISTLLKSSKNSNSTTAPAFRQF